VHHNKHGNYHQQSGAIDANDDGSNESEGVVQKVSEGIANRFIELTHVLSKAIHDPSHGHSLVKLVQTSIKKRFYNLLMDLSSLFKTSDNNH
jgi:hypothetical protein